MRSLHYLNGGTLSPFPAEPEHMSASFSNGANRCHFSWSTHFYRYPGAMLNYLEKWVDQLKWQRLAPFEKLADMLLKHVEGLVNYCRTKVRFGVVEAVNGNIRMLINRGRGYKNLRYLLLKAKRMAVTNVEFLAVQRVKKVA